jgi:hypothetical protein
VTDELNPDFFTANEKFGFNVPLVISKNDKAADVRKLVNGATNAIAVLIMRHWLASAQTYDIDITVTLTKRN